MEKSYVGGSNRKWICDPEWTNRIPKPKAKESALERTGNRSGESANVQIAELGNLTFRRADGAVTVFGEAIATSFTDTDQGER